MNRRLIYIIIIGLVILLGLAGVLFYLSNQQQKTTNTQSANQITKVVDEQVISPIAAFNNSSIWYFNSEGRLFKSNTDGTNPSEFPLPSLPGGTLQTVLWPIIGSDFISVTSTDTGIVKNYYDSTNKIFITLAPNIQWLDWLPDGKRIVYIWQSTDKKTQQLVVAGPDGTGFKTVTSVFWPDLAVKASPDGKIALMYRINIAGDTNKIYAVDLTSGQITTLLDSGKNLEATWLPNGNGFLFAQSTGTAYPKILFYDLGKHEVTDLNLSTSLAKTVVDSASKILYAAVPNKDNSGDTFVKIDLSNDKQTSYFQPTSRVTVRSIILVGNLVYYIDNSDGKLYTIGN